MSNEKKELLKKPDGGTKKDPQKKRKNTEAEKQNRTVAKKSNKPAGAAGKKTDNGKSRPVKKTKRLSNEAKGILVIALSIFVALCLFTGGQSGIVGSVGGFFKNVLMGLFGAAAYVFFIIIFFAGLNLFIDKKEKTNSYNPWLIMTMFLIASIISALIYDDTAFGGAGFWGELVSMYEFGVDGYGGGVFGGLLCRLLCMLIGNVGVWILNLSIMLILIIMLTGVSFEKFIKRMAYSVKSKAETIRENMNSEVEADIDEEELSERTRIRREKAVQKKLKRKTAQTAENNYSEHDEAESRDYERYGPVRSEEYFELYFKGEDIDALGGIVSAGANADLNAEKSLKNTTVKSTATAFDPFSDDDLVRDSNSNEFNGRVYGDGENDIYNYEAEDNDIEIISFEMPFDENKSDMEQIAEVAMAVDSLDENSDIKINTARIPRFSFDDLETDIFAADNSGLQDISDSVLSDRYNTAENPNVEYSFDDTDFDVSLGGNRGIITEIPSDIGGYTKPKDEDYFEPPSLVQLEERLDAQVKSARDAGVPMDRAFTAVKNNTVKEAAETANRIDNEIKKNEEEVRKIEYQLPTVDLLAEVAISSKNQAGMRAELEEKANRLLETLASFKVDAKIINITCGPTVTRFELQPGLGVKVSKITGLADDIALSLAASGVRIEAPIPGKAAIGIEIPNEKASAVPIREVIDTDMFRNFKSKTVFALGKDISGNCVVADVAKFPHVLVAGATGSGKSVCVNSLIMSILFKAKPDEVKMIMIDPKKVELGVYNGIPHLLIPVVTDPKHAAGALNWAVAEMDNRYNLFTSNKVRNLQEYNELMEKDGEPDSKLPEIIIIIDELADLMIAAKNEVEDSINRLAAVARAAGMYLVIATQRPSVDVITGVIKANVPSRIAFAVSSQVDSRTILDTPGAEKLLGKGDMLYAPIGSQKPMRIQGNFVSPEELKLVTDFIKSQYEASYDEDIIEHIERERETAELKGGDDSGGLSSSARDEVFVKAVELALESGQASVAMLQRKLKIGYQKAARIIDEMEANGFIGPYEGTKARQVLITRAEFNEMMFNNLE